MPESTRITRTYNELPGLEMLGMTYMVILEYEPKGIMKRVGKSLTYTLKKDLSSDDAYVVQNALIEMAFLFEKYRLAGKQVSPQEISRFRWSKYVGKAVVSEQDIAVLRSELISFIQRSYAVPSVGSALWVLGKLADPTTKPILLEAIRHLLPTDPQSLYQAMIALENLGENVFDGAPRRSITEVEENRRLAQDYLSVLPNTTE